MIRRCHDPSAPNYKRYGGRGIAVCASWRTAFAAFYRDLGPRPSNQHTLERIDNNGMYAPGNCCWATRDRQDRNKRSNTWLTFNGQTKIIADWARDTGLHVKTLRERIKRGWSAHDALTTPTEPRHWNKSPAGPQGRIPCARASGRFKRHGDRSGERNARAKLNTAQVAAIRQQRARGDTLAAIAARFNVNVTTIGRVVNNKCWTGG